MIKKHIVRSYATPPTYVVVGLQLWICTIFAVASSTQAADRNFWSTRLPDA